MKQFNPDTFESDDEFMDLLMIFLTHQLHYQSVAEMFRCLSPTQADMVESKLCGPWFTAFHNYIEDNQPHLLGLMPFKHEIISTRVYDEGEAVSRHALYREVEFIGRSIPDGMHWVRLHLCEVFFDMLGFVTADQINELAFGGEQ